jgi:hypothetical protein
VGVIKLSNPGDAHIIIDNLNFTDAGAHTAGSNPTYKLSRTAEYDISDVVNPYVPLVADILKGNNSLNFTDLAIAPYFLSPHKSIYLTVSIDSLGGAQRGSIWNLSVPTYGLSYGLDERDLGYDANGNGGADDFVKNQIYAEGKASMAGVILSP